MKKDTGPAEIDHFKGIKENYGATKADLTRGHTEGMHPNEKKEDAWDAEVEMMGEESGQDGGFLGRGRDFER